MPKRNAQGGGSIRQRKEAHGKPDTLQDATPVLADKYKSLCMEKRKKKYGRN